MTSAGRPSKLTPETIKTLTDAIGLGASYVDACYMAGLNYDTFMNWKKRGETAKAGEYFLFIQSINEAKSAGKMRHLAVINNAAAKGEWKASLEWLKRLDRGNWGDVSKVEMNQTGEVIMIVKYATDDKPSETSQKAD